MHLKQIDTNICWVNAQFIWRRSSSIGQTLRSISSQAGQQLLKVLSEVNILLDQIEQQGNKQ